MKIAIVGAGAIGGLVGAKLALAGEEVTFIVRGTNLEAIRNTIKSAGTGTLPDILTVGLIFVVAGLELKREFVAGDLRDPRRAAVPNTQK